MSCLPTLAEALEVPISVLVRGERIELEGKKPDEIMEQVDQAVANTLELSKKNMDRDWASAGVLFLVGGAILLWGMGVIYRGPILLWSDIPARYAAYMLLLFILIPVGVPAILYWVRTRHPWLTTFKTYLLSWLAAFLLVMAGTALFYWEFYATLTNVELLQYDFNDTVVYEVLFQLLPLCGALTTAVNTICAGLNVVRLKE